jgi:hypothetical protein
MTIQENFSSFRHRDSVGCISDGGVGWEIDRIDTSSRNGEARTKIKRGKKCEKGK